MRSKALMIKKRRIRDAEKEILSLLEPATSKERAVLEKMTGSQKLLVRAVLREKERRLKDRMQEALRSV